MSQMAPKATLAIQWNSLTADTDFLAYTAIDPSIMKKSRKTTTWAIIWPRTLNIVFTSISKTCKQSVVGWYWDA